MKHRQSITKMSRKWFEIAKRLLGEGDEIQKCYPGKINGRYGYLIISNKKVLFLHETGFINKTYSIIYEKKRENIEKVTLEGTYELSISDILGNTFTLTTLELPAEIIQKNLETSVEAPITG